MRRAARCCDEGEIWRDADLGDTIERLGRDGAAPFYTGDIARATIDWIAAHDGILSAEDLRRYEAIEREPLCVRYRGRDVYTNPPPSAGGILLALALGRLNRTPGGPPSLQAIVAAMEEAQDERTPEFLEGLAEEGFAELFLGSLGSRMGSTTHISVIDGAGRACSVTCTNGEGSGVVVPGTGIHVNNIMGEEDLSPLGFHHAPRRTADAVDDVADRRDRRRRRAHRAGLLGLQPDPQRAAADDRRGRRPRPARRRGPGRAARALRGRRDLRRTRAFRSTS